MTKEELDRIKKAYSSGLKVQIWFNGYWEDFDARDYSMYSDPFSENRLYRIVGSDYADIAEKRIAELEKENAELKKDNSEWEKASDKWKSDYELTNKQLTNVKEIIREFMKYEINEYDGSLEIHFEELKKQAEQFLKDSEVEK